MADERKPRSDPSLTKEDADFAAAVAAAGQEIRVSRSWGDELDAEVTTLARLQVDLEDARDPLKPSGDREIMAAAQAFRSQEAKVNEMLQRRLANEVKKARQG